MSKYPLFHKAPTPFEPTHSSFQRNYALHRSIGDIPDCVPAVDTFIDRTPEEAQAMIAADPYWLVWNNYRHGIISWNEWLNHPIHKRIPYSPIRR
jgi:hypothetical protein